MKLLVNSELYQIGVKESESSAKNYFQVTLDVNIIDLLIGNLQNLINISIKPIESLSNCLKLQNKIAQNVIYEIPFAAFRSELIIPIN